MRRNSEFLIVEILLLGGLSSCFNAFVCCFGSDHACGFESRNAVKSKGCVW